MDHNESSISNGEKTETKSIIGKWLNWLQEAIKRTFSGHSRSTWIWIILFTIIFIVSVVIVILQYQDETWLFSIVVHWFIVPIIDLREWGWVIFILFMGIQGILVPIPSELVLLTSGLIWGLIGGSILGIIGSMVAGILTYYIAVLGGRPMMERFLGQENLDVLDFYIGKYGPAAILLARAFPFMAFDPISYASGFLKIEFKSYCIATLIGSLIRCVFYAWLGSLLIQGGNNVEDIVNDPIAMQAFINAGSSQFNVLLVIIVVILGSAYLFYQFMLMPYLRKKHLEATASNSSIIND
ncbi:MAG: VTT domain-containing protein [Candidatus Heimdallarchaeota archaeon]|nr:MAG: VTT domain-containing protein [Candidatus Heimdallarchaeota archaeon]